MSSIWWERYGDEWLAATQFLQDIGDTLDDDFEFRPPLMTALRILGKPDVVVLLRRLDETNLDVRLLVERTHAALRSLVSEMREAQRRDTTEYNAQLVAAHAWQIQWLSNISLDLEEVELVRREDGGDAPA